MKDIVRKYFVNVQRVADQKKAATIVYERNKDAIKKLAKWDADPVCNWSNTMRNLMAKELYQNDAYKPKREKNKKSYTRKVKHKKIMTWQYMP